jgi:hypothetical protein
MKQSIREALAKQYLAVHPGADHDAIAQRALEHRDWMPHAEMPGRP